MEQPPDNDAKLSTLRKESAYKRLRSTVDMVTGLLVVSAFVQLVVTPSALSFASLISSAGGSLLFRALIILLIDIADSFIRQMNPEE